MKLLCKTGQSILTKNPHFFQILGVLHKLQWHSLNHKVIIININTNNTGLPFDPSQWEEHIKHEQSQDTQWANEFANTLTQDKQFTPQDFNPNLDKFHEQWEDYREQLESNTEYKFTRNNPYLDAPITFLLNESLHQNLTETLFCLEAILQRDSTNAPVWTKLGIVQRLNK